MFTVSKGCKVVDPGSQSEEILKRGERVKGVNWRPSETLVYWRELQPGIKKLLVKRGFDESAEQQEP